MKTIAITLSLLAVSLTTLPVAAEETVGDCMALSRQVQTALAAGSGDISAARRDARMGELACGQGQFARGSTYYRKALGDLGK
jgi:hypothetical protein